MDEIEELLLEGKVIERRLCRIKKRLQILSKISGTNIDIDDWKKS